MRPSTIALVLIALVSFARGVSAHGGHANDAGYTYMAPGGASGPSNEAPADVELELEKLAREREAAAGRKASAAQLARLDRRKSDLELRHRVAVLRLDRDRARAAGRMEEAMKLDRAIHEAKQRRQAPTRPGRGR